MKNKTIQKLQERMKTPTSVPTTTIYQDNENMTTDNPKMGQWKVGQGDIIKSAIKVAENFDCLPLREQERAQFGSIQVLIVLTTV